MSELLTTEEAARRLQRSPMRVRQLCQAGQLEGAQKVGRDWVIPSATVDAYQPPRIGWEPGRPRKPTA